MDLTEITCNGKSTATKASLDEIKKKKFLSL